MAGKQTGYIANIEKNALEWLGGMADISQFQPSQEILHGVDQIFGTHLAAQTVGQGIRKMPQVADVAPANWKQEAAGAATQGALSLLAPEAVGRMFPEVAAAGMGSFPRAALVGAAGGVVGQGLADVVPPQWKDVAATAGMIATGAGLEGGEALLRGGPQAAGDVARAAVGPTGFLQKSRPVIDPATAPVAIDPATGFPVVDAAGQPVRDLSKGRPFTAAGEPVTATRWERQAAGRAIAKSMGHEAGQPAPVVPSEPPRTVPGTTYTIGTLTGDVGTLGEERRLQGTEHGRARFGQQEAANNAARVRHLENLSPDEARETARDWMRSHLAQMQAEEEASAAAGHAGADQVLEAAGAGPGLPDVRTIGQGQQAALEDMRQPVKAAVGRGLDAIDPEGKFALDTSGVAAKGDEIERGIGKGGRLLDAERAPLEAAKSMRGVQLFSDLRDLLGNTAEAMREIRRDPKYGPESKPYKRMSALMGAIHDAMSDAAGRAAEAEAAGGVVPEGGIIDQFDGIDRSATGTAPEGSAAGRGNPILPGSDAAGSADSNGALGAGGANRAGAERAGGPGTGPGDRGVATSPRTPVALLRRPQNLLEFLTERGGIQPDSDLQAMGAGEYHHRAGGRLLSAKGAEPDYAREAAVEEGFLPANADINDLKNRIAEGLAGNHTYRETEALKAHQYEQAKREQDAWDQAYRQARDGVLAAEDGLGMRLSRSEVDHAIDLVMSDPAMHPEAALRIAAMAGEDELLQRNAQRDAFGFPGLPAGAEQAEAPLVAPLVENLPAGEVSDLRAQNRRYAEYKDTYRRGAVGDVLRPGARPGEFAMSAAEAPGALWRAGPKGADVAAELIGKFGRDKAREILGDYPALTLRNEAMKNGAWSDTGYRQWLNRFGPALSKFPEIADRFRTAAEAQRSAEDAAARGQERIRQFENSAARHFLAKNGKEVEPQAAINSLVGSKTAGADARELMRLVGHDEAAKAGLRRNFIDWVVQQTRGTAEAGTTGTKEVLNGKMQTLLREPKVRAVGQAVLTPDQWRGLVATGNELELAQRLWNATKIKGSPGTAADLLAHAKRLGGGFSHMVALIMADRAGEAIGAAAAGLHGPVGVGVGLAAAGAAELLRAARAAGLQRVEELQTEGHLNPALGRVLLQDAVANPRAPILRDTARRILALSTGAGLSAHSHHGSGH